MCCCCFNLHRHQIHLISYGCVSFILITTGLVFTVFAIFQKDSQIGKVWLAGPTTMVVGLVLCGKVIIDWGPAMVHARHGSIDSRLEEQLQDRQASLSSMPLRASGQIQFEHEPKCNGRSRPSADARSCLIYSQYEPSLNNINGFQSLTRSNASIPRTRNTSSTANTNSPQSSNDMCECSQYGTIRRYDPPFQGEEFVLNERNYLI